MAMLNITRWYLENPGNICMYLYVYIYIYAARRPGRDLDGTFGVGHLFLHLSIELRPELVGLKRSILGRLFPNGPRSRIRIGIPFRREIRKQDSHRQCNRNGKKTMKRFWLVVEPYPSGKYEFVSWDDDIPNIWKNHPNVPNHQPGLDSPNSIPAIAAQPSPRPPSQHQPPRLPWQSPPLWPCEHRPTPGRSAVPRAENAGKRMGKGWENSCVTCDLWLATCYCLQWLPNPISKINDRWSMVKTKNSAACQDKSRISIRLQRDWATPLWVWWHEKNNTICLQQTLPTFMSSP